LNITKNWIKGIDYPEFMLDRSLTTLEGGYLIGDESPRDAIARIARRVKELIPSKVYKGNLEAAVFNHIWNGSICPSSPVWSNFGTNRGLPISCFGSYVDDSIEGIYGTLKENAKMSQLGGGTSSYWGDVRPRGSAISGQTGSTGGVYEFLKDFDGMISRVSQGGTRRGSHAVYIPFTHGDLEELRDIRKVGNDIQDLFYAVVMTDEDYESIYAEDEVALDKWARILESRNETGLPYILNSTNANKGFSTPPWYGEGEEKILASNLCFTGDTIVAIADGTNAKSIKDLAEWSKGELKFPVYSGKERSKSKRGRSGGGTVESSAWKSEIKMATAFKTGTKEVIKVTLSNGDSFKCTPDHEIALNDGGYVKAKDSVGKELSSFFTYTGLEKQSPYRHINTISNAANKQHILIHGALGEKSEGDHVDHIMNDLDYPDVVSNLQRITKESHRIKTSGEIKGDRNWVHRIEDREAYKLNQKRASGGSRNSRCKLTNDELITECKKILESKGGFNWKLYSEHKYNVDDRFPITFTDYRFNRSFSKLVDYVYGRDTYEGELDVVPEYVSHVTRNLGKDSLRKGYIESHFYDRTESSIKSKGLLVDSIESCGVEDVYDLTVEDNHNFYIITSTNDDKYLNCQGVLVHNCSEIFLPSNTNESFVCCLLSMNALNYDTWKNDDAVEVAIIIQEAILTDFIIKTSGINDMQRARRFAERHRSIGLGVLGLATYLQSKMQPFVGIYANAINTKLFKDLRDKAEKASENLAIHLGNAPIVNEYNIKNGTSHLRRHATLLAMAPTTSNATIAGGVSPGIEPLASNYYVQKSAKGNFTIVNPYLKTLITQKYPEHDTPETIDSIRKSGGSVQHLTWMDSDEREVFLTFSEINQFEIVRLAAIRQKFIDQGQSLNVHIAPDTDPKAVSALYLMGAYLGIKSFYYQRSSNVLRDKGDNNTLTMDASACVSCEG
jgi:ribonucleotide reductase alpha subunit